MELPSEHAEYMSLFLGVKRQVGVLDESSSEGNSTSDKSVRGPHRVEGQLKYVTVLYHGLHGSVRADSALSVRKKNGATSLHAVLDSKGLDKGKRAVTMIAEMYSKVFVEAGKQALGCRDSYHSLELQMYNEETRNHPLLSNNT